MGDRCRQLIVEAVVIGACLGIVAQVLRQIAGDAMELGAATAPWLSVGFALAVRAARCEAAGRTLLAYLFAWLVAYHVLFAVGQSVPFSAAFREAFPWLVLMVPVAVILAPVAWHARSGGAVGDACLAVPIAWSLPETVENAQRGDLGAAAVIAALALLPAVATGRRRIRIVTVATATLVLAVGAFTLGPVVRGLIPS